MQVVLVTESCELVNKYNKLEIYIKTIYDSVSSNNIYERLK